MRTRIRAAVRLSGYDRHVGIEEVMTRRSILKRDNDNGSHEFVNAKDEASESIQERQQFSLFRFERQNAMKTNI
jgi:hypothetical protein